MEAEAPQGPSRRAAGVSRECSQAQDLTFYYFAIQIIRMIADHEKEEDEIMQQADDWIFFALIIDRILLVIFVIVILLGSFGLFYRFMFNLTAVNIFEESHYSRYQPPPKHPVINGTLSV